MLNRYWRWRRLSYSLFKVKDTCLQWQTKDRVLPWFREHQCKCLLTWEHSPSKMTDYWGKQTKQNKTKKPKQKLAPQNIKEWPAFESIIKAYNFCKVVPPFFSLFLFPFLFFFFLSSFFGDWWNSMLVYVMMSVPLSNWPRGLVRSSAAKTYLFLGDCKLLFSILQLNTETNHPAHAVVQWQMHSLEWEDSCSCTVADAFRRVRWSMRLYSGRCIP